MELNSFEDKVIEHILQSSAPGKHAARSALRHLERAWELADKMPELAVFSAITAEEESATALFHILKKYRYENAQILNIRSHLHKTALHPFLLAMGKLFHEFTRSYSPKFEFNSDLSCDGAERLRIRLTVLSETGERLWAYPMPPLEFTVLNDGAIHQFEPELSKLATEKNAASAYTYVQKLSNRRNLVLYAKNNGIPHITKNIEPFLIYRKSVVFSHLIAILLIDPYSEQQSFVQQALIAFLSMLRAMPDENSIK